MKKVPFTFKLAIIICISALFISVWAVSYFGFSIDQITGDVQGLVGITIPAVCGDGTCSTPTENYNNCPADCTSTCGDTVCDPTEDTTTCCTDCGCSAGYTCASNTCEIVEQPITSAPYRQNTGGGGPSAISAASFKVRPETIRAILIPGQTAEKIFEITNDGAEPLRMYLQIEGLKGKLNLDTDNIYLEPRTSVKVRVIFFALEGYPPGVYTGKIIITAGNSLVKEITAILEIQSEKPKFDAEIHIPEIFKTIYAGQTLETQITIYDISKIGERDVHVYYEIKDSADNVILSEDEIVTVRNQLTLPKIFILPKDLELGDYVLAVKAVYDESVGTDSEVFSIVEKRLEYSTPALMLSVILSLIALMIYILHSKRLLGFKKIK